MKKILVSLGIVILAALVLVGGFYLYRNYSAQKSYSVVYLSSGEIYVGHLSSFPRLQLTDSYLLHVAKDPNDATKSNFQLTPLSDALWAPQKLYLNREHILFYGPLSEASKVAQALQVKK